MPFAHCMRTVASEQLSARGGYQTQIIPVTSITEPEVPELQNYKFSVLILALLSNYIGGYSWRTLKEIKGPLSISMLNNNDSNQPWVNYSGIDLWTLKSCIHAMKK